MKNPQLLSRRATSRLRASTVSSLLHRPLTSRFSTDAASHPSNKVQVYLSKSTDPFLNLSVEHRLLQITPPDSTILTLYVNSPSIIFGRNQNPWLQVNLNRLAQIAQDPSNVGWKDSPIQLIRRRSGGGAVFHDVGNVNFSVICPPEHFDRNKHAEMVVRALKALGRPDTRVNERHDIVMDVASEAEAATYKISGSAYKLTRLRSLHHGTCLLRSPNLSSISGLLRSPALGYLDARGVDSVRRPVKNIDVGNDEFKDAVMSEFKSMYGDVHFRGEFNDTALQVEEIRRGYQELQSKSWIWGQTPRFTFSTHPTEEDPRPRPELPFDLNMSLLARHGVIDEVNIKHSDGATIDALDASIFQGVSIWEIKNWAASLTQAGLGGGLSEEAGAWLNGIFGTEYTKI
ncbi:biotin/lipoate a/B protein ligase family domain-containing protein [Trichoderma breve]|uniref:Putative lipoate-protein ligase A n=1 Tax=Trichoderma breve TaxID=2034170 RepID=A0A9W9BDE7_9HYPO|nr:biotin/lipoate a/B protein ligase family domain-containing protein [Trichoderma breve]KAJ4857791.1 biotin/lipoate a/B protein ligase family domain-containing protein [Trichoderma breve]